MLYLQAINLPFVALQLCQNSAAPLENQRVAGRNGPFTVEDGSIATVASPKILRRRSPAPRRGSTSPQSSFLLGDWPVPDATYTILSRTLSSIGKFVCWSYINRESSSASITSDVEANSLSRNDRRHNRAIATRHMGCNLGLGPIEFENGKTVVTVKRFQNRDSHESLT